MKDRKGEVKSVSRILWQAGHFFQLSTRLPFPTHPFSIPQFIHKIQCVPFHTDNKGKVYACDEYRSVTNLGVWVNRSTAPQRSDIWTSWGWKGSKEAGEDAEKVLGRDRFNFCPPDTSEWEIYQTNSVSDCGSTVSSATLQLLLPLTLRPPQPPLTKFFWFLWKSKSFSSYRTHLSLFILWDTQGSLQKILGLRWGVGWWGVQRFRTKS